MVFIYTDCRNISYYFNPITSIVNPPFRLLTSTYSDVFHPIVNCRCITAKELSLSTTVTNGVLLNDFGNFNLVLPITLLNEYEIICIIVLPTVSICADMLSQFTMCSQLLTDSYLNKFSKQNKF